MKSVTEAPIVSPANSQKATQTRPTYSKWQSIWLLSSDKCALYTRIYTIVRHTEENTSEVQEQLTNFNILPKRYQKYRNGVTQWPQRFDGFVKRFVEIWFGMSRPACADVEGPRMTPPRPPKWASGHPKWTPICKNGSQMTPRGFLKDTMRNKMGDKGPKTYPKDAKSYKKNNDWDDWLLFRK